MKQSDKYTYFLNEARKILPEDRIYTDELRTLSWGTDASFYHQIPKIVLRTDGEDEVSRLMRLCHDCQTPFTFRAAGTSLSGQSVSDSVLIVAGKNWEKYSISENHDTITMQPGLVGGRVNRLLKPLRRVLPPDPASINSAMIGGIVNNNASGMSCGVHANSDHMLVSARIVLADGTILDTGDDDSRRRFRQTHATFLERITNLRDKVRANKPLADRIRKKYSIKNVTGLNLRPLTAYDDPFDIIAHSIVGSEGTLAFLSQVTMRTLREYPYRASAMVYFHNMVDSCRAVVEMKKLESTEEDLKMSAERQVVKCAEMLDYLSLASVDDPVFLKYKQDVDSGKVVGVKPGDYHNLTAILTETRATTHEALERNVQAITDTLAQFSLYCHPGFSEDPKVYGKYWAIRQGIFPTVGGMRPTGTSCLIEDVAFPVEHLPEATVKLQQIIASHGYSDGCIYGHALEGNYHFILNQSFKEANEVERYASMMRDVVGLVRSYDGSLKAEHGTGRNMAPFVREEWGDDAYWAMRELKEIFDPDNLVNPGVIFNDNDKCFVEHLKQLPELDFDFPALPDGSAYAKAMGAHKSSTQEMVEGVKRANKCIECGFCEVNCLTCGLTLSSRMRIACQREIARLRRGDEKDKARAQRLESQYRYYGNQTCAADGLCATSCPMKINTGDLTHLLRQISMNGSRLSYKAGDTAARHLQSLKSGLRATLSLANAGHTVLGTKAMEAIASGMHKAGLPLWTPAMPKAAHVDQPALEGENESVRQNRESDGQPTEDMPLKVVYFPSCLNQTMGLAKGAPVKKSVVGEMASLANKAGYEVIFPKGMANMCCGQIWESKGMMDIADRKTAELEAALYEASHEGRYPVLCDQSPCLHRMRKMMTRVRLYEPVEFILTFLKPRLRFHQLHRTVAVHATCSMREMGLVDEFVNLARLCADNVIVPEGVGCCGFAGDRGFTHPEMNKYALRHLRKQIEDNHVECGYSNSRTCEIGLQHHSGIPYMSIAYLVNEATE